MTGMLKQLLFGKREKSNVVAKQKPPARAVDIYDDIRRGSPHAKKPGLPANEHFSDPMSPETAKDFSFDSGSIFLGVTDGLIETITDQYGRTYPAVTGGGQMIGTKDDRHVLTIAGTRAGKGRAAIIPNLLTYPGSVLATDPKGELATLTAAHRAEKLGHKVFVLDPFRTVSGAAEKYTDCCFNPLSVLSTKNPTLIEDAGLIADALVIRPDTVKDPHWDESALALIEGLILHVASSPDEHLDLVNVHERLTRRFDETLEEMKANPWANFSIQAVAENFDAKPDKESDSILSNARRHLHFLSYESIQNVLRGDSIDLGELKTQPVTIYLCLPAMRMGTCARWLRLFVNLTLAAMEKEKERPQHPVLMCLDEFAVLGHMKTIEDAAGQIAGLDCKLWPILQDLGQLKSLYKDRWETFLGNAGTLQFFGNSDLTTLEWISKRLGKTPTLKAQGARASMDRKAGDVDFENSKGEEAHDLLTPSEISRLFGREDPKLRQLILVPSRCAMILQRAYFDRYDYFKDMIPSQNEKQSD